MTHLRTAARRLFSIVRRLRRVGTALLPDAHVYAGVALIAHGAALAYAPAGPVLLGLGLIWIVRFGGTR